MGLYQAGFNVVGVDKDPQPHYPFPFWQRDVLDLDPTWLAQFDFVWASPPCQCFIRGTGQRGTRGNFLNLIPATRDLLKAGGTMYCIENVSEAHREMRRDLMLCGSMFGLRLIRHRIFELEGFKAYPKIHREHHPKFITVAGHAGGSSTRDGTRGHGSTAEWREAIGTAARRRLRAR
jgi:DNA (cytosine-5)-methyltransferase 1